MEEKNMIYEEKDILEKKIIDEIICNIYRIE
jgi:hypothetical protein